MNFETTRRNLLKAMLAVPVLGTLLAALSPFMRFLNPFHRAGGDSVLSRWQIRQRV